MSEPREEPVTDLAIKPDEVVMGVKINVELIEEAQRQISAPTCDDAVNEALRRLVEQERAKRRAARESIQRMVDSGELTFRSLDEVDE
jgi:Arc/MetJ family transcription regulator